MDFAKELFNVDEEVSLYNYKNIKSKLTKLLSSYYNEDEINKILFKNIEQFF